MAKKKVEKTPPGGLLILSERLAEGRVSIRLNVADRDEALATLAREAERHGLIDDQRVFLERLKAREAEVSTGVGQGLAVPHTKAPGAQNTFVMAATLRRPIDYQAIDGDPVDVIFLIGGKPDESGLSLQLLARIVRLTRQPDFLDQLRRQKSVKKFLEVVQTAEQALYPNE